MKTINIALLLISLTNTTYSQQNTVPDYVRDNGNPKIEGLSETNAETNGKISYVYLPDEHPDAAVRELEKKFMDHSIPNKNAEGFLYRLRMEIERGSIVAYYNHDQKLIGVDEKYKKVKLPNIIVHSIQKELPGWLITDDSYFYSQKNGVVIKKQYELKIEKENKTRHIVVYADGRIKK